MLTVIVLTRNGVCLLQLLYLFHLFDVKDKADFCGGPVWRFERDLRLRMLLLQLLKASFLLNLFQVVVERLAGLLIA